MKLYIVKDVEKFARHAIIRIVPKKRGGGFQFEPGQYATLSVKSGGRWTATRCLSMTGPAGDGTLEFSFRVTGIFTGDLAAARPGDLVRVRGAFGEFTVPDDAEEVYMFAGGIGITPFMSIIRTAALHNQNRPRLTLIYSCQSEDDIPFGNELQNIARQYSALNLNILLSTLPDNNTAYQQGPISPEYLDRLVESSHPRSYFMLCGPDPMMQSLYTQLLDNGVFSDYILTETFASGVRSERNVFGMSSTQLTYALSVFALTLVVGTIAYMDLDHTVAAAVAKARAANQSVADALSNAAKTQSTQQTSSSNSATTTHTASPSVTTTPSYAYNTPTYTPVYQAPQTSAS